MFGGYEAARYVHFFAMAAIVGFLVIHVGHGRSGAEEPAGHDHRAVDFFFFFFFFFFKKKNKEARNVAHPQVSAGGRSRAPGQGRGEADADPARRALPARRRKPGRPRLAHGLRHRQRAERRARADQGVQVQRLCAGLAVQPEQARPDLSRQRRQASVPVQRLLPRGGRARGRSSEDYRLEVGGLVENKRSWTLAGSMRCRRKRRSRA